MTVFFRIPAHPGPSLDARHDGGKGGACRVAEVRMKTRKKQLVIPSVERGTWAGGDAQDEPRADQAHIPIRFTGCSLNRGADALSPAYTRV